MCLPPNVSEISGSYGGVHDDGGLLEYNGLMMEAVQTSETSVYFYETTRRDPQGCHLHVCF
jgi:hypothetical protein